MNRLAQLMQTEWRLQWRSPGMWASVAASLLFSVFTVVRQETYAEIALNVGAPILLVASIMLGLVWTASARRSHTTGCLEFIETSPFPAQLRRAVEVAASQVAWLVILMAVLALNLLVYRLRNGAFPLGRPTDLWLVALVLLPPMNAWFAVARLIGRWLRVPVASALLLAIWSATVFAPARFLWITPNATPDTISDLVLFGRDVGMTFILHRGGLLLLSLALLAVASLPERGDDRGVGRALMTLLVPVVFIAFLCFPGSVEQLGVVNHSDRLQAWRERAQDSRRWTAAEFSGGTAVIGLPYERWASASMSAVQELAHLSGSALPDGAWLVQVPGTEGSQEGEIVAVPESIYRNLDAEHVLRRRLIADWVRQSAGGGPPAAGGAVPELDVQVQNGARLFLEWRIAAEMLPAPYVETEVASWHAAAVSLQSGPGNKGPREEGLLGTDQLFHWRGGKGGFSTLQVEVAEALWGEFRHEPIPALLAACRSRPVAVGTGPISAKSYVDAFRQALKRGTE